MKEDHALKTVRSIQSMGDVSPYTAFWRMYTLQMLFTENKTPSI